MTLPTTCMCARQCSSAASPSPASISSTRRSLGADAAAADRQRPDDVVGLADRGDGPGDDLVEHLGDDRQRLVAGQRRRAARGTPRSRRRTPRGPRSPPPPRRSGARSSSTARLAPPLRRDRLARRSARADPGPRTRRRAARCGSAARARPCGRSSRSSGSWTTTPPCTPRTTVTSPSVSRIRSASRSDGRDTPNRSTRSGSWPSESPSDSSPETIRPRSSSAICCGFSRVGAVPGFASRSPCALRGRGRGGPAERYGRDRPPGHHASPSSPKKNALALPYSHASRTSSGRSRAAASPRHRSIESTG